MTIGRKTIDHEIIMKVIGPITEMNCTVKTSTTPENTKETIHIAEIDHIVEISHEATTKITIRRKIIGI